MKELQDKFGITTLGQHYFESSNGDLNPVFNFRSDGPTKGNQDAIVVAQVTGDILTPAGDKFDFKDVGWQEMKAVSGKLASTIFRVNTTGGELIIDDSDGVSTSQSANVARN